MITLPFGEIADFSEWRVGDSKNVWDHVPIETVGRLISLKSNHFIKTYTEVKVH